MSDKTKNKSVLQANGLQATLAELKQEVLALYLADQIPWVVGYSGGKDSTATLQILWLALQDLKPEERTKPIYVITTDTLVENPVVAAWVDVSLEQMQTAAEEQGLPITAHKLTPEIHNTFWVNLIGRGYPAPRPRFRWCTERLKIDPTSRFITDVVKQNAEAIVVLGTRKAESSSRARVMNRLEQQRVRDNLNPHTTLPNAYVYPPIQNWTDDDVWMFLMQVKNPWGHNNKDLLTMYQGASADGECPLVIDTSTPSCGDSRFGCWVCTLVEKDKSMQAMILNDQDKEWMLPLLELRNELDIHDDSHLRDFRRMNGQVYIFKTKDGEEKKVPGPYTQKAREQWVRKLLRAQQYVRAEGPPEMSNIELISIAELREIRRIWVMDKHEIEDTLPAIYEAETGSPFPDGVLDETQIFDKGDLNLLHELCDGDEIHYQLLRELISVERQFVSNGRRRGLFEALEKAIRKNYFEDEEDAIQRALALKGRLDEGREKVDSLLDLHEMGG
ncbi:MAG: DNA phosphorothioation system sulfurtransferase DndC [Kordiimonas sp.]